MRQHDPRTCHYCRLTRAAVAGDPRLKPRGACRGSITCPTCRAAPGQACLRPSEHKAAEMHPERYRTVERADAAACPGFEPYRTADGAVGCAHCSGLPEDHRTPIAATGTRPPAQGLLFG